MSKLILVVALFAAAALASSEIQDNQWWYQYFLKDSSNNWLAFFGAHVEPTATTPGWQTDITHCAYESPAYNGDYRKYVCGDKQSNLEAMLGENTCYVWVYNELGCSGEPAYAWGFVKDKIYTLANVASPYDTSYKFYWDDLTTARYTWVDESNPKIRVQQADSMLAIEFCDSTNCADASRPTMPVGCTDTLYMPGFPFMAHSRPDIYNNDMNSMLVICTEDTGCPRSCYGKTCGTYDDCGEPCIGTCDDGYYCKHSANKYSCETSQYGKITYESFVDYDSYVYAAMAFEGTTPASARYPPSFYTTPTITHLENAFKGDLYWASNKKVPADAIVFQEIAYFTQEIHQIKIKYDINIDAVNSFTNELYSASSLSAYLAKYILNENKVYQGLLGGPFTGAFNLDYYKLSNTVNGTTTSQTTTTESEWVKSVEIKDSWVAHTPEPQQDSAATLVAWMALAVPLVALLL